MCRPAYTSRDTAAMYPVGMYLPYSIDPAVSAAPLLGKQSCDQRHGEPPPLLPSPSASESWLALAHACPRIPSVPLVH